MQGTYKQEGLALVDMVNGAAAVVSISAKSALNWPDNAMPICCCSHSNAMVSYKGGRGGYWRGGGHAAGAGQGECCCAQHDARHALHDHNLQHTAHLIAGPADMPRSDTSLFGHLHRHIPPTHLYK